MSSSAGWHRTASPEFERMNANGLLGLHGDDLRIAAELESVGSWIDRLPPDVEDHELHARAGRCVRCMRLVVPTDDVRRRGDGAWMHQSCGPAAGGSSRN